MGIGFAEAVRAVKDAAEPSAVGLAASEDDPAGDLQRRRSLSYHVHRTPSLQFPVYQLAKRGGIYI